MATILRPNGIQMGSSIMDVAGEAPSYPLRAWFSFNSASPSGVIGGNISSFTNDGVGTFNITFITAAPDANYTIFTGVERRFDGSVYRTILTYTGNKTINGFTIYVMGNLPGESSALFPFAPVGYLYAAVTY